MNFQRLSKIEKHDWYIDLAFRNANKKATDIKSQMRRRPDTIKRAELAKVSEIRRTLRRHLDIILKSFPSLDGMTEFYQELVRATLDYAELKKSLGGLRWAQKKVDYFSDIYANKIRRCADFRRMTAYSREYYGRISSVMKQVKKPLEYLENARKVMQEYPSIKSNMFTVAIAGFPNVGKTTLLAKITTANPEIADYAFTTRKLNIGYATISNHKVQFIDTPGTLNRFDKMNQIEKQAVLAIKYCADLVVYVFDPSPQSLDKAKQLKLLKGLRKKGKDLIIYISKTDLPDADISAIEGLKIERFSDPEALKKAIFVLLGKS